MIKFRYVINCSDIRYTSKKDALAAAKQLCNEVSERVTVTDRVTGQHIGSYSWVPSGPKLDATNLLEQREDDTPKADAKKLAPARPTAPLSAVVEPEPALTPPSPAALETTGAAQGSGRPALFAAHRTGIAAPVGWSDDQRRASMIIERDPRGGVVLDAQGRVRTRVEPNYLATRKLHAELINEASAVIVKANAEATKILTSAAQASEEALKRAAEINAWLEQHAPANG